MEPRQKVVVAVVVLLVAYLVYMMVAYKMANGGSSGGGGGGGGGNTPVAGQPYSRWSGWGFSGPNLTGSPSSVADYSTCEANCATTPGCQYWTFNQNAPATGNNCWYMTPNGLTQNSALWTGAVYGAGGVAPSPPSVGWPTGTAIPYLAPSSFKSKFY